MAGLGKTREGRREGAHIFGFRFALEIRFDGSVLLVQLGEVWDEILDDVGVRQRVDAGFVLGVSGDATWAERSVSSHSALGPCTVW